MSKIAVFIGSAHPELAAEIYAHPATPLLPSTLQRFANDCLGVRLEANCRERDVFLIQPLVPPVQEHLGMISGSPTNLEIALRQNHWIAELVERFDEIALPDAWLVAGSIAQTIWNLRCGQPAEQGIKDVDLVYFDDQDFSIDAEVGHERRLRDLFRHLPIKLDVKNEARVHLWYQERFGYRIRPYRSSPDAIATFPTTATAIGVRRTHGNFEYCAPFGLDDLFSLVVRPNKKQITRAIYEAKIERWCSLWPRLTIVPWEEIAVSASSAVRA